MSQWVVQAVGSGSVNANWRTITLINRYTRHQEWSMRQSFRIRTISKYMHQESTSSQVTDAMLRYPKYMDMTHHHHWQIHILSISRGGASPLHTSLRRPNKCPVWISKDKLSSAIKSFHRSSSSGLCPCPWSTFSASKVEAQDLAGSQSDTNYNMLILTTCQKFPGHFYPLLQLLLRSCKEVGYLILIIYLQEV